MYNGVVREREKERIWLARKYSTKTNGIKEIKDMKSESYVITQHLSYAFVRSSLCIIFIIKFIFYDGMQRGIKRS